MMPVRRFRPGHDAIGVVCPSHSIVEFPRRLERAASFLAQATGSAVRFGAQALEREGRLSGDADARTRDLESMLLDEAVGMVLSGTGGYNSIDVALRLDVDLFRAHPKPIVGQSDITALLLVLHDRTGCPTFHGPALLHDFGEADPLAWQAEDLLSCIAEDTRGRSLTDPPLISDAFQLWERDDALAPARRPPSARRSWGRSAAEGVLLGGNLDTLVAVAAAGLLPDTTGALVFFEAAFGDVEKVARDLTVLEARGVFSTAAGVVAALPYRVAGGDRVWDLALGVARRAGIPLLSGLSFGHTTPVMTLPIGAPARLDPVDCSLTLLAEVTR